MKRTPRRRRRLLTCGAAPALALLVGLCAGCADPRSPSSHLAAATGSASASATPSGSRLVGASPSSLCGRAVPLLSARLRTTVTASRPYRGFIVLPGIDKIPAQQCVVVASAGQPVHQVVIRRADKDADVLFRTLARFDTPGLTTVPAGPELPTGAEAYWQSVGTTLWLRDQNRVVTVQIVTDAEAAPGLQAVARAVARGVLDGS